jgi:hypothetical protein
LLFENRITHKSGCFDIGIFAWLSGGKLVHDFQFQIHVKSGQMAKLKCSCIPATGASGFSAKKVSQLALALKNLPLKSCWPLKDCKIYEYSSKGNSTISLEMITQISLSYFWFLAANAKRQ